jgi:hypothetical protein
MDLVFYLKDSEAKLTSAKRYDVRKRYWEYALPIITEVETFVGEFSAAVILIRLILNPAFLESVDLALTVLRILIMPGSNPILEVQIQAPNKSAFDALFRHKDEIEAALGVAS